MSVRFVSVRRRTAHRAAIAMVATVALVVGVGGSVTGAAPKPKPGGGLGVPTPGTPALACSVPAVQGAIDANITFDNDGDPGTGQITLDTAQSLTTAAPASAPYCRIDGTIVTPTDEINDVKFQVSMPTNFNGRYFQAGQGGAGGSVSNPRAEMLNLGFVSASTDRGAGASMGLNFGADTGLCQDCGFHMAAITGQRITKAFYNRTSLVRYVSGCSNGGADGRGNVLAYGTGDFDGVVSGDSPQGWGLVLGFGRIAKYLQENPSGWISPAQLAQVEAAVLAQYDGADGAVDGVIQDDRNFRLDDQVLADAGLTAAQIAAVHFVNSPWHVDSEVVSPDGTFPGYPIGRLSQWSLLFGFAPPPWTTGQATAAAGFTVINSFMLADDPDFDFNAHTFDEIAMMFVENREPVSTDHSAFRDGGGKMVLYDGIGDGFVTYFEFLRTLDVLNQNEGHPNGLDQWMRMFLISGMDHCGGINGPSDAELKFILATVDWVEQGIAPDSVVGSRPASSTRPARTFLLCPEPKAPVYQNVGSVNDAANWTCVNMPRNSRCGDEDWDPLRGCPSQSPGRGVSFVIQ